MQFGIYLEMGACLCHDITDDELDATLEAQNQELAHENDHDHQNENNNQIASSTYQPPIPQTGEASHLIKARKYKQKYNSLTNFRRKGSHSPELGVKAIPEITVSTGGGGIAAIGMAEENEYQPSPILDPIIGEELIGYCKEKNTKKALKLLDKYPEMAKYQDKDKETPLIWAAFSGADKIVDKLLTMDSDPDHLNVYNQTAFIAACLNAQKHTAERLFNHGIGNWSTIDVMDDDAISLICSNDWSTLLGRALETYGSHISMVYQGDSRIWDYIYYKPSHWNKEIIRLLCQHSTKEELEKPHTENHECLLIHACRTGNEILLRHLLEKGVDLEVTSVDGRTPLFLAIVVAERKRMATLLLKTGKAQQDIWPKAYGNLCRYLTEHNWNSQLKLCLRLNVFSPQDVAKWNGEYETYLAKRPNLSSEVSDSQITEIAI